MDRTAPMARAVTARWMRSAHSAPVEVFDGRHFSTTVGWVRAWEQVRTEHVLDHRHLGAPARAERTAKRLGVPWGPSVDAEIQPYLARPAAAELPSADLRPAPAR